MSGAIRQWARRELERSTGNLEWSASHIIGVIEQYQEPHPEIAEPLIQIVELIKAANDAILKVRASI